MNLKRKAVLITGGAGFIGTNLAHHLLETGEHVILIDNLSRCGSEKNLQWLTDNHDKALLEIKIGDVRDPDIFKSVLKNVDTVYHLAAQVAVTKSLLNPIEDFDVNLRGTLNLLEALRTMQDPPFLLFTSTNKVYGKLQNLKLSETATRYCQSDRGGTASVCEMHNLDFHSPYGCSKGAADQYVLDYARTFSIPAAVFRMSCIYGPHQFGTEDQGWVAHFLIRTLQNQPITIYGNGKQVRDILYIDDLVRAFCAVRLHAHSCNAQAFTIGGGEECTVSILELLDIIKSFHGMIPNIQFAPWRTADQYYYVSDTSKFELLTRWNVTTQVQSGIYKLYTWITKNGSCKPYNLVSEGAV